MMSNHSNIFPDIRNELARCTRTLVDCICSVYYRVRVIKGLVLKVDNKAQGASAFCESVLYKVPLQTRLSVNSVRTEVV